VPNQFKPPALIQFIFCIFKGIIFHSNLNILVVGGSCTGVWRPGSGAQYWVMGYTFDQLKAEDGKHFAKGLRLKILRMFDDNSYVAVWQPGSGGQHWWAGISHDEWHPIDTEMFNKGYRITSLDYFGDLISVVYRPGTGEQHVHGNITYDEFKQLYSQYFSKGLRLVTMARFYSNTWDFNQFMGVWRVGSGGQHWYTNTGSSWDDFKKTDADLQQKGYRLIAFTYSGINAIWNEGTGEQIVDSGVGWDTFKKHDEEHFKNGLRLVDLVVGASP
jgi:Bacterial tandem repeat domain 1